MTREEAHDNIPKIDNYQTWGIIHDTIDNIFDYFESQMKQNNKLVSMMNEEMQDFKFTNCNDCINKIDNCFTEICMSCKRYYGCYFEKRENVPSANKEK